MSKSLLVFCILICIMCLTHLHKSCVQSMSVNEITSGGLLADMMDDKPSHHLRHQQHQQRQHHHHHQPHHHHHLHNPNKTSESPTPTSTTNGRQSPNMWTILGQTVKSHDGDGSNEQSDYENDAKYKEFEQQHLQEKFRREHGTHDTDHAMEHPKKSLSCPKCQSRPELRMTEEELTNLRIEYVKNQILQKLRLTERPQVSASNIPKPVAEGATIHQDNAQEHVKRTPDEFYGKTTQKIVFPKLGEFGFGLFICCGYRIFTAVFLCVGPCIRSRCVEVRFKHFGINSNATLAKSERKRFSADQNAHLGVDFFGNPSQRILKAKNVIKKCKYEKPFIIGGI